MSPVSNALKNGQSALHGKRLYKPDALELLARWSRDVDFVHSSPCWVWKGKTTNWGYGHVSVGQQGKAVHRAVYEALVGPIPEGLVIDHLCSNRLCVNPAHLEPVEHEENVRRGNRKRWAGFTSCPQGHEYIPENTLYYKGNRRCRECNRLGCKERYDRQKEHI